MPTTDATVPLPAAASMDTPAKVSQKNFKENFTLLNEIFYNCQEFPSITLHVPKL